MKPLSKGLMFHSEACNILHTKKFVFFPCVNSRVIAEGAIESQSEEMALC